MVVMEIDAREDPVRVLNRFDLSYLVAAFCGEMQVDEYHACM